MADVAAPTDLLRRPGDHPGAGLNEHFALLRAEVRRPGGEEVKSPGAGLTVVHRREPRRGPRDRDAAGRQPLWWPR